MAFPIAPITINTTTGDSAPPLALTLRRTDGSLINLSGCTVNLVIKDPRTGLHTNDANSQCAISDAVHGICTYTWSLAGTDCPDPGQYICRLRIFYADSSRESAPITLVAEDDI